MAGCFNSPQSLNGLVLYKNILLRMILNGCFWWAGDFPSHGDFETQASSSLWFSHAQMFYL